MRTKIDFLYLQTVLLLVGFGILAIYSHTFYSQIFFGRYSCLHKELKFVGLGLLILLLTIVISLDNYRKSLLSANLSSKRFFRILFKVFPRPFTLISLLWLLFFGLILWNVGRVLFGGYDVKRESFFFQPQEFFKFAHLLLLSQMAEDDKRPLLCVIFSLFATAAVFLQKAVGTAVILFLSSLFLFILMRLKTIFILFYLGLALSFIVVGVWKISYAQERLKGFIQRKRERIDFSRREDLKKMTHQDYSELAIGSGMLTGRGLGGGRQKFGFLSLVHKDFIFSGICEEMGFIGAVIILVLFFILLLRGFLIAAAFSSGFEYLISAGVSIIIGLYFFVHIFVGLNLIPCTGQPLPFVSYGGSALLSNLWAAGIVLNISYLLSHK